MLTNNLLGGILVSGDYTILPFEVSEVLYMSLSKHKSDVWLKGWSLFKETEYYKVAIRDKSTGYYDTYRFPIDMNFRITKHSDMVYYTFFKYYLEEFTRDYFTKEVANTRIHTSPVMVYGVSVKPLYTTIYWYLGKNLAQELMNRFTYAFSTYLDESRYKDIYDRKKFNDEKFGLQGLMEDGKGLDRRSKN